MWTYIGSAILAGLITQIVKTEVFKAADAKAMQLTGKPADPKRLEVVYAITMLVNALVPIFNSWIVFTTVLLILIRAGKKS